MTAQTAAVDCRVLMMRRNVIVVSAAAVVFAGALCVYSLRWPLVTALIRGEFRDVQPITTAELDAWLADKTRAAPLLVDVRARAEYDVSHLPGAEHGGQETNFEIGDEQKDRPIVLYCSIGYRSGRFARTLRAAGFSNVRNLEGSIFKWVNEGRPVYRGEHRVNEVHPYNSTWALLLNAPHRARVAAR